MVIPWPELRLSKITSTWKPDALVSMAGVTPLFTVWVSAVALVGALLPLYVALAAVPIPVAPSNIRTLVVNGSVAAPTFHTTLAETLAMVAPEGTSALVVPKPLNLIVFVWFLPYDTGPALPSCGV